MHCLSCSDIGIQSGETAQVETMPPLSSLQDYAKLLWYQHMAQPIQEVPTADNDI